MIKIIVEGPPACGKTFFIKRVLLPAIRRVCGDFRMSMEGFNVVERHGPDRAEYRDQYD